MPELLEQVQQQQHHKELVYRRQKRPEQYQQFSQRLHYRSQNLQHQQKYQQQEQKQKEEEEVEVGKARKSQPRKFYNLNTKIKGSESSKIIITTNRAATTTPRPIPSNRSTSSTATTTPSIISARRLCATILPLMLSLVCHYSNAENPSVEASTVANLPRIFHGILQGRPQSNGKSAYSIDRSANIIESFNFSTTLEDHFLSIENHTERLESLSIVDVERDREAQLQFIDSQPIFDFGLTRNVTGRTGQSEAVIKCRVDMLNDKSVSWIRKRDLHILTVGTTTYTTDKRFEVSTTKDEREWILHIKAPQARDSGIYECQVNTEPKISMAFQLNIIDIPPDAKATITGPADLHFKVGSVIVLQCLVEQPTVKDIGPIYWYRGEQMITPVKQDDNTDYDTGASDSASLSPSSRVAAAVDNANLLGEDARSLQAVTNDITLDFAARIAMESQLGDVLKSRLRISKAQTTDTGNYTCQPTTANGASVMVHVINDENPAAMQKSRAASLSAQTAALLARVALSFVACSCCRWWWLAAIQIKKHRIWKKGCCTLLLVLIAIVMVARISLLGQE